MSAPYIIWTMRRTGGTTLATLLGTLSEHPAVQHEPFNNDRIFGDIVRNWLQTKDAARLQAEIADVLGPLPLIKHCHELMPGELNRALMEAATAKGYRHIVLDRRAETARILSLEFAKLTGAWGGHDAAKIHHMIELGEIRLQPVDATQAVHHMQFCRNRRQDLLQLFQEVGRPPFVAYFEDIYSDPDTGRQLVRRIVNFLEIDPAQHSGYEALVTDALLHQGQNSARVMKAVPNLEEVRQKLDGVGETGSVCFPPS